MISLAKTCSRHSLRTRSRSSFLRPRSGTVAAVAWSPSLGVTAAVRPTTAGQLFSIAKPPIGAQRLLCKAVPSNGAATAEQGHGRGTVWAWLREQMIKDRKPLENLEMTTNVSNLCGHLSFVVLALAYLETDVLALR